MTLDDITNNNNEQTSQQVTDSPQINSQSTKTQSTQTQKSHRKVKKSSKRRVNDVKHVSRKLIMAWKLASEHQSITWKEIAPIIDSVEYLSSHWKNDERLKSIEPVAVDIVSQVNKIHLELNLRVFGMNRLRIITEEFLNLLKQEREAFIQEVKEKEKEKERNKIDSENDSQDPSSESGSVIPPSPSPSALNENNKNDINLPTATAAAVAATDSTSEKPEKTKKSEPKPLRSKEELLARLINSLTQLFNLLNEPADITPYSSAPNSPRLSPPQKHKNKKRNIFSGFFSNDKKQTSSNYSSNSTLYNSDLNNNSSNGLELYKNNIVSEWQEYTRKFVEPNYLFKVCKCYLAANPSAIPKKASLIGQNWICVANEISVSLWNILKKREDDLASSLIFLTLYKHGSPEIIERAINTIGSQLPQHFYVRLEYALKVKEFDEFTKEEQLMLDSNYMPEDAQSQPASPSLSSIHKKSNPDMSKTASLAMKEKKKKHSSTSTKSESGEEPLSFAEMLAM